MMHSMVRVECPDDIVYSKCVNPPHILRNTCRMRRMWHIHVMLNCCLDILSNRLIISIFGPSRSSSKSSTLSTVGCTRLIDRQPIPMRIGRGYFPRTKMRVLYVTSPRSSRSYNNNFNFITLPRRNCVIFSSGPY